MRSRSKTIVVNVVVAAVVVAVLGASASAWTVSTVESASTRVSIANMIDGLGGDSSTDFVLDIVTGGHITATARVDHDGPYSLLLNGGDFTGTDTADGYKLPDNNTGNPAFIGIYDGTMDLQAIETFGLDRDATIEIGANGTLIVALNYAEILDGNRYNLYNFIDDGSVYASTGLILDVTDLGGGAVQVNAVVPEPATLVLLGLGALVSRRRKRA